MTADTELDNAEWPDTIDADAMAELGMRMGQATAIGFVAVTRNCTHAERVAFIRAFLSTVSGLSQQAIGHDATAEAFTFVAGLRPVASTAAH